LTTAQNGQIVPEYCNGRRGSHSGYGVAASTHEQTDTAFGAPERGSAAVNLRFH
jgi:hypothetical protein